MAGDVVVPGGVAELFELVEDHAVGPGAANLPAHVEDLLDVGFAAGRGDHFGADFLEPFEALAAHLLGQDADGLAAQAGAVERAAAAVVAGRGPDGFLRGGIELAGDELGHEAAEGGADFVRAGGEPLADDADDAGRRAGERRTGTRSSCRR